MLTRKRKAIIELAESSKYPKQVKNEEVISHSDEIPSELEQDDIQETNKSSAAFILDRSDGHLVTPEETGIIGAEIMTLNKGDTIVLESEMNKIGDPIQIIRRDENCEESSNKNSQSSQEVPEVGDSSEKKIENALRESISINIVNSTRSGVINALETVNSSVENNIEIVEGFIANTLDEKQCLTTVAGCLDNQYSDLEVVKHTLDDIQCPAIVTESLDDNLCPTVDKNSLNSKLCPVVVTDSLDSAQSSAVITDSLNDNEGPAVIDFVDANHCPSLTMDSLETITPVSVTPPNINKDSSENNKQANKKKGKLTKSGSSTPSKTKELLRYESSPWKLTPEQSIEHFRALNEQLMLLNQQGRNLSSTIHRPRSKPQTQTNKDDDECDIYNSDNFEVNWFESDYIKSSTPDKKRNSKGLKAFKSPKKPSSKKSHKTEDLMAFDETDKSSSKNSHEKEGMEEKVDEADKSSSEKSHEKEDTEALDVMNKPSSKKSYKKVMVTIDKTNKQSLIKSYKKKDMVTMGKRSSKKCYKKEVIVTPDETDNLTIDETDNLTIDETDKPSKKSNKKKDKMTINKMDKQSLKLSEQKDDMATIDEIDLENVLEENALRNHLTAINVKNILHHVITNEDVLTMLKNTIREKKGNKQINFPNIIYEPTLTRSKVKELIEKGSCPWPISPLKKVRKHFVEEHFDEEESSDEDYKPDEEEEEEEERETEDEESFLSPQSSEADSTPVPCTPSKSVPDEVMTQDPAADEETNDHSNLSENAAPMSPVGSPLSPNTIEDQDKDITKEEADLIALRTRSKLPLNDTPLDVIEASFVAPDITTDMYDCSCVDEDWKNFLVGFMKHDPDLNDTFDDEVNDPEYNFLEDEDILEKEEGLEKEELRNDRAVQISKQELKDLINEICEIDEEEDEDLTEKSMLESPLMTSQMIVETVSKPSQSSSNIEIFITMTDNERKQLDDQMRKHVQLMTQIFLLTCDIEEFILLAEECKMFLNELKTFGNTSLVGEKSAFNAMNLAEAVKIVNKERPPPKKGDVKLRRKRSLPSGSLVEIPNEIKEVFVRSKVFLYPDYLPIGHVSLVSKKKRYFTQAEDNLITLGLQQFQSFSKPEKFIQLYIIPIKTVDQIKTRIKNLSSHCAKSPNSPLFAYFKLHNKTPDFPRLGLDFDPRQVKAPIDQIEKCPNWVYVYQQMLIKQEEAPICTPTLKEFRFMERNSRKGQQKVKSTSFNQSNITQAAANPLPISISPETSPLKTLTTSPCTTQTKILSGLSLLTLRTPVPSPLTVFMTTSPDKNIVCTTSINTELRTNVFTLVPSPVNVMSTSPIKKTISLTPLKDIVTTSILAPTTNSHMSQSTSHSNISSAPILSFSNTSSNSHQLQPAPTQSVSTVVSDTNSISSIPTHISSTIDLNTIQKTPQKKVKMHPLLPNLSPKAVSPVKQVSPILEKTKSKKPIKRLQSLKSILPKTFIYVSPVKKAAAMLNALERKRQKNPVCRHLLPKLTLNLRSNMNQIGYVKKMPTINITKELESLPASPENIMEISSPACVDFSEIEYLGTGQENTVENINECPDIDSQSDVDNDDINDDINNVTEDENQDAINNDNVDDLAELMAASTTIRSATRRPTINRKKKLQKKIESTVALLAPDLVEKDPLKDERNTALAQSYLNQVKITLKNDTEKYEDFLRTLHEFQQNPNNSVIQLYKNMSEILKDYPVLLEDFSGFLLPEEAEECGVFFQNKAFADARLFLRKLEVQFSDHPAYFQRILKMFVQWQSNPNCCPNDLQDSIKPLLRPHPYLLNEFTFLFPNEKPPDSYIYDFEEISLEETKQDSLVSEEDDFEYVNIPDNGDELYGTKKCICQCHEISTNLKLMKRSRHCPACGVKFINGHIYVLTTGMTPRPVQVVYLNNGPTTKDNIKKELGDEAKENIKTGSLSSLRKETRESTISSPKKNKGNILKEKKIAPQKSLNEQPESVVSDASSLFNYSSISQQHSQNTIQAAISEINSLPSLQSNFPSKASHHITVLSPAGDTQPFEVPGAESSDVSDSELVNLKTIPKEIESDSQKMADSKTGDGQKEEKQERIILRISLNTGSKNETGPTAETDFDDSTKLSERRTLEQHKAERSDKKAIETNKVAISEENSGEEVSSAKLSSVWTKNADREILQTCQLKGRATDEIFHSIAVKLGNKTTAEVKVRFQQLMALFSKQVHDSDHTDRGSASGSDDD